MKPTSSFAGLLAAALFLAPHPAWAQGAPAPDDKAERGKTHFNSAIVLYREGDYRGALIEFRRAYEISHNARVLYNIGQAEFELQDYAGALRSFQMYLAQGGAEVDPERRAAVEADVRKLNARVAKIIIKTNASGADVLLDDVVVGQAPLPEAVIASAGRRKITVHQAEQLPVTRLIDVAGGDSPTVTIDLPLPRSRQPAPVVIVPAAPPPAAPSRTGLWVTLALTSSLAAGAVTTGVLALLARNDTELKLSRHDVKAADITAAHEKTATLALVTDVLGGAALAMGVTTLIIGVTGSKAGAAAPKQAVTLQVSPRGALLLVGRF